MIESESDAVTRIEAETERQERTLLGPGNWERVNRVWGCLYYEALYRGDERAVTLRRDNTGWTKTDHGVVAVNVVVFRHRRRRKSRFVQTTTTDPTVASREALIVAVRRGWCGRGGWREYGQSRTLLWPSGFDFPAVSRRRTHRR